MLNGNGNILHHCRRIKHSSTLTHIKTTGTVHNGEKVKRDEILTIASVCPVHFCYYATLQAGLQGGLVGLSFSVAIYRSLIVKDKGNRKIVTK